MEAAIRETVQAYRAPGRHAGERGHYALPGPVGNSPEESWRRVLDVNLTGVFLCVKAALPIMRKQKKGVLLATASMAGLASSPAGIEYNVSKTGVIMLMRHVAHVYGPDGIRSVAICPGWVNAFPEAAVGCVPQPVARSCDNRRRLAASRRRRMWRLPWPSSRAMRPLSSQARPS